MMKKIDDFYIGWVPHTSGYTKKFIRNVVIILVVAIAGVSFLVSVLQKQFSNAVFEYGKTVVIKGVYQHYPVPGIKVASTSDMVGNKSFITILLVGYGKHGVDGIISELEKKAGTSFDQKEITIKGTLIYHDGKSLLQIDQYDLPLIEINTPPENKYPPVVIQDKGVQFFCGEIIDPKCYFGVMKPGQGKPHRDCAIRCLAGGIPPVFVTQNQSGQKNYYLMLSSNGEKLSPSVLQKLIADPVSFSGKLKYFDDWSIIYLDKISGIKRLNKFSYKKVNVISCVP